MATLEFPRTIGDTEPVLEKDWQRDGEFGYCPACGSIGIEHAPCAQSDVTSFYCSDDTCKRVSYQENDALNGETIVGERIDRTSWWDVKPEEWQQRELNEFVTWNAEQFSLAFYEKHDLV